MAPYEFKTDFESGKFEVHGLPADAKKLVRVEGDKARRLADLTLHRGDLKFASDCLESMTRVPAAEDRMRAGLWRISIISFLKCFGSSKSRSSLVAKKVFEGRPASNMLAFRFFDSLRDKHYVHDENSYSQCTVVAAINDGTKDFKVEDVLAPLLTFGVDGPENEKNLKVLIDAASDWVATEYDKLVMSIRQDLEKMSYEELSSLPDVQFRVPTVEDAHTQRPTTR